jgi:flagellar hook-basal body complex protein FliE
MYKTADDYQNAAEESEMNFALGYATSTHDLAIAQQKANISLQYTVKVTNKALEAYKELMNMQI